MNTYINPVHGRLLAAVVAIIILLGTARGHAQVVWTPPCGVINVVNTTGCPAQLRLITAPGFLPIINLPAFGAAAFPVPFANMTINGVVSAAGNFYPAQPPPPPGACACLAGEFHTCCVLLNAGGCCFDVCYNQATCTVTLRAALCGVCRP